MENVHTRFKDYVMNPVGFLFACLGKEPDIFFAKDIKEEAKKRGYEIKNHGSALKKNAAALGYVKINAGNYTFKGKTCSVVAYAREELAEDKERIEELLWQREKVALEAKLGRKLAD